LCAKGKRGPLHGVPVWRCGRWESWTTFNPQETVMGLDDDISSGTGEQEGPADGGATGVPNEHDGGADGGADPNAEGPADGGAAVDEHDGGADGGA
jgi:hypothetical protein